MKWNLLAIEVTEYKYHTGYKWRVMTIPLARLGPISSPILGAWDTQSSLELRAYVIWSCGTNAMPHASHSHPFQPSQLLFSSRALQPCLTISVFALPAACNQQPPPALGLHEAFLHLLQAFVSVSLFHKAFSQPCNINL